MFYFNKVIINQYIKLFYLSAFTKINIFHFLGGIKKGAEAPFLYRFNLAL